MRLNPEEITWDEINQSLKEKYCMMPFIWNTWCIDQLFVGKGKHLSYINLKRKGLSLVYDFIGFSPRLDGPKVETSWQEGVVKESYLLLPSQETQREEPERNWPETIYKLLTINDLVSPPGPPPNSTFSWCNDLPSAPSLNTETFGGRFPNCNTHSSYICRDRQENGISQGRNGFRVALY